MQSEIIFSGEPAFIEYFINTSAALWIEEFAFTVKQGIILRLFVRLSNSA
jgi:hypothetical protein